MCHLASNLVVQDRSEVIWVVLPVVQLSTLFWTVVSPINLLPLPLGGRVRMISGRYLTARRIFVFLFYLLGKSVLIPFQLSWLTWSVHLSENHFTRKFA